MNYINSVVYSIVFIKCLVNFIQRLKKYYVLYKVQTLSLLNLKYFSILDIFSTIWE